MSSLVISLDFELMWGMRDHAGIADYGRNILGVREAIPSMLALFQAYDVRATWAAVGMLMFRTKKELIESLPSAKPTYVNVKLSPYEGGYIEMVGEDEGRDPYHFGASLVDQILEVEGMELGSHTFSHYYCLEDGQTDEQFAEDLRAALHASERWGVRPVSLVFPRNQFNTSYLSLCKSLGFRCYRGNEQSWIYRPSSESEESSLRRAVRLLDSYLNLTGSNSFETRHGCPSDLVDVPASRFLRPYLPTLARFDQLRLHRITSAMEAAARKGRCFHLWWHPHNFGANLRENLALLEHILLRFSELRETHGMQSRTMGDVAAQVPM